MVVSKHKKKVRRRTEKGAAAVEFALVLPILVLLVFGIVEFGRAYNAYLSVTHAAREGARLAAVGKYDKATVVKRAFPLKEPALIVPVAPTYPQGVGAGKPVEVPIAYDFTLNLPFLGKNPIQLKSTGIMRLE